MAQIETAHEYPHTSNGDEREIRAPHQPVCAECREQGLDPVLSKEDMQMSEGLGWGQWALILLGVLTGLYLLTALVVL